MTPEQRLRAGRAVAARLAETQSTPPALARAAGVAPNTIRALIRGDRWPRPDTRERIVVALGWPRGELVRRALDGEVAQLSTADLLLEVLRRVELLEGATKLSIRQVR